MFKNPSDKEIFKLLEEAKNIAIVGMSNKEERSSFLIAKELLKAGYNVIPVNPMLAGQEILGQKVYSSLKEIKEEIDIVDIFRRSEFLPEIAQEFLEIDAKVFWAQSGVENEEAAQLIALKKPKVTVVMDRCIKIELMRKSWEQTEA